MSFLSGLKAFGKDVLHVIAWVGSPTGQQDVGIVEAGVEAVAPVTIPIVGLINSWLKKVYTVESIAVAASQGTGTGADKAAAVMAAVTPTVLQYAQQEGLPARTAEQIKAANDAIVAFLNAMTK